MVGSLKSNDCFQLFVDFIYMSIAHFSCHLLHWQTSKKIDQNISFKIYKINEHYQCKSFDTQCMQTILNFLFCTTILTFHGSWDERIVWSKKSCQNYKYYFWCPDMQHWKDTQCCHYNLTDQWGKNILNFITPQNKRPVNLSM